MNIELIFLKTRPAGVSFGPVTDNWFTYHIVWKIYSYNKYKVTCI